MKKESSLRRMGIGGGFSPVCRPMAKAVPRRLCRLMRQVCPVPGRWLTRKFPLRETVAHLSTNASSKKQRGGYPVALLMI
jgi:hypothetical protein